MKSFLLYTGARALLFAVAWALVWLPASFFLDWNSVSALWTALLAMAVSSVASLFVLRRPRARLAGQVGAGAARVQRRYEAARSREDKTQG